MNSNKYFWPGNIAKARIINEILKDERILSGKSVKIFDYGAGMGGDWDLIISKYPQISLFCYEPNKHSFESLKKKLSKYKVSLFAGEEVYQTDFKADYIVSFSVFEHCYDRTSYLEFAKEHLEDSGIFYLNYDDGHFRNVIDLDKILSSKNQFKEWVQNKIAFLLPKIGAINRYQKRVNKKDLDDLLATIDFEIISQRYENLGALKSLQKTIETEKKDDFLEFWMETEDRLNAYFLNQNGKEELGDINNLWIQMASRSLKLRKRSSPLSVDR